jgi:hypothetical protein
VNTAKITNMQFWGDYVYLDVEERRRFVSTAHEYLIEQVQYTSPLGLPAAAPAYPLRLEFNHPLKELIWVIKRDIMNQYHEWFNFSSLSISETGTRTDLLSTGILQVDGLDRFQERDAGYFRLVQAWQFHSVIPNDDFLYIYSFALRPEELQPSGSLNASRLDSLVLQITTNQTTTPARGNSTARVYATNHNVLRIVDGFGGLLFTI